MRNFDKLVNKLKSNEAFIITSSHNLLYYTGFSGGEGLAVIGRNILYLFTDSRYIEAATYEAKEFTVINCSVYYSKLNEIFNSNKIENIFFEESFVSVDLFEKVKNSLDKEYKFLPASDVLEDERIIKSETELKFIKKAEEITSDAYTRVLNRIKEGMTELEICAEIEYLMKRSGAQKTSFDTIVVSGKKSSMPHGIPDNKKINVGDFITMDFGCIYNGYCSDMTRTVVFGKADNKQKEIYDVVLDAQLMALEYMSAGKEAYLCDKVARDYIEKCGYGKYFSHSLGHGVGVLIHEKPTLSLKSQMILKKNMVVSCEPGIYIPDFGGVRIEDLVVIKENGIENLTTANKEFTVI